MALHAVRVSCVLASPRLSGKGFRIGDEWSCLSVIDISIPPASSSTTRWRENWAMRGGV